MGRADDLWQYFYEWKPKELNPKNNKYIKYVRCKLKKKDLNHEYDCTGEFTLGDSATTSLHYHLVHQHPEEYVELQRGREAAQAKKKVAAEELAKIRQSQQDFDAYSHGNNK